MYDLSKMTNRFNTNSYKWDVKENELPMWVADMDFETAPAIIDALHNRVDHKIFGYNTVPDDYFEAYQKWWERRHHFHMEKDWMMFVTGVVPAISSVVRKVTTVGENVLIMSPVYNIFYNSILNNGRHVLSSDLVFDGKEYHICIGSYTIEGEHAGYYARMSPYPRIDSYAEDIPVLVEK